MAYRLYVDPDLTHRPEAMAVGIVITLIAVSYTHLRAHETVLDIVCRLLLETKKNVLTTPRWQYLAVTQRMVL